jgi:hypothetical protein
MDVVKAEELVICICNDTNSTESFEKTEYGERVSNCISSRYTLKSSGNAKEKENCKK